MKFVRAHADKATSKATSGEYAHTHTHVPTATNKQQRKLSDNETFHMSMTFAWWGKGQATVI